MLLRISQVYGQMGDIFLQGEKQLEGTGIELQKMRESGVPTIAEFVVEIHQRMGY